jgi:hypothetical protein
MQKLSFGRKTWYYEALTRMRIVYFLQQSDYSDRFLVLLHGKTRRAGAEDRRGSDRHDVEFVSGEDRRLR